MALLVCGGAGYIGSHMVRALLERGERVVVLDSLRTGHRQAVPAAAAFHAGDMRDPAVLDAVFSAQPVEAVLHFAAISLVGESMRRPLDYLDNNVGGMLALLEAMRRHGVGRLVFSSSAAVYGEPDSVPVAEDAPLHPASPYGESKLMMERAAWWAERAHGIRSVVLRYFNVAGAWPDGSLGEDHRPESHLIPRLLLSALGKLPEFTIFGEDYPTDDGTCVRDYIGVMDLVEAHVRALEHLRRGGASLTCNLGNGAGFSVRQVVEAVRRVTGLRLKVGSASRRPGDPARLVASAGRAERELGWKAATGLDAMVAAAWAWHRAHPDGWGGGAPSA